MKHVYVPAVGGHPHFDRSVGRVGFFRVRGPCVYEVSSGMSCGQLADHVIHSHGDGCRCLQCCKWGELTRKEIVVAVAICDGKTRRQIAEELNISPKTVDTHRLCVMGKLECRNEIELLRLAVRRGWVVL